MSKKPKKGKGKDKVGKNKRLVESPVSRHSSVPLSEDLRLRLEYEGSASSKQNFESTVQTDGGPMNADEQALLERKRKIVEDIKSKKQMMAEFY